MSITKSIHDEAKLMTSPKAARSIAASRSRRTPRMRYLILIISLLILLAIGCKSQRNQNAPVSDSTRDLAPNSGTVQADEQDTTTKSQVSLVAPDAAPKQVAEAALKAIAANDKQALTSLIAVKKVNQEIEAITRGRSALQKMSDNAIPTTVAAIMSEINGLDAVGRQIDQETISGTTALVTVKGKRAGKEQTRRFFLVQEDNQWRLVPSHR